MPHIQIYDQKRIRNMNAPSLRLLTVGCERRSSRPLQTIGESECSNRKVQSVAKSLSAVFPAFNEEANIKSAVKYAYRIISKLAPVFEIVLVNDGSKDRTGDICDQLAKEFSNVRVVHHTRNRGYGAALRSGIEQARYDLIFFSDSDGQFDFRELAMFLEHANAYDIVAGYRAPRHDPPHRLLFAFGWNILVRLVLGIRIRDIDCAFKVFNRYVFDRIRIRTMGAMVNTEIFAQASKFRMRVKEIPVSHFPRRQGKSTGGSVGVIKKAFRELNKMRRVLSTTTPRQLGLFREHVSGLAAGDRRVETNQSYGGSPTAKRFKPIDKASKAIFLLKPVRFHYKKEIGSDGARQFGLVAEDVEKVNPDLVVHDADGKPYRVRYNAVNAMLLNEFLKEHWTMEQLKNDFQATVAEQQREIKALAETVNEQDLQIQQVNVKLQTFAANRPE
jgi:hypothetical protein